MLVTSCRRHQAKGEEILVIYSTLLTKNLLKINYTVNMALIAVIRG